MKVPRSMVALVAVAAALVLPVGPAQTDTTPSVVGYGQHTEGPTKVLNLESGPVVVGPLTASFSVGKDHAMCAVGEFGGEIAAFNMLVYAHQITNRIWTKVAGRDELTLIGVARSITMMGGAVVEDVLTPMSATVYDSGAAGLGDYFHISIDTTLWPHTTFGKDLDGNPLPLFSGDVAIPANTIAGPPSA